MFQKSTVFFNNNNRLSLTIDFDRLGGVVRTIHGLRVGREQKGTKLRSVIHPTKSKIHSGSFYDL